MGEIYPREIKIRILFTRLPFTLVTLVGLAIGALVTNTAFQSISHQWLSHTGFAPNDLWYWRIERMFTSALVTSGGKVFWVALFWVALAVGAAEWMTGRTRAAATFWGVHLLALVSKLVIRFVSIH